jgi:hypothetical protein
MFTRKTLSAITMVVVAIVAILARVAWNDGNIGWAHMIGLGRQGFAPRPDLVLAWELAAAPTPALKSGMIVAKGRGPKQTKVGWFAILRLAPVVIWLSAGTRLGTLELFR